MTTADFHEIIPDVGQTIHLYNFVFDEHMLRDGLLNVVLENTPNLIHTFEERDVIELEKEFARIWTETHHRQKGSEFIIQGCVERILIDLSRYNDSRSIRTPNYENGPLHPSIKKGLVYLQRHFRETLTLEQVAKMTGLSANYFSELFKKQAGVSFQTYVQELRLNFARSLLLSSDMPVTEVCLGSGFNTLQHFERAFKSKFESSPRELRKQLAVPRSQTLGCDRPEKRV